VPVAFSLGATPSVKPVTDYLSYVGGKKGQARGKKPIVIGYINAQGGNPEFPQVTRTVVGVTKFINKELNGVHGQPVKLHTCYIAQAEEEGKRCGQEMMNDSNVKVIIFAAVITGNQSIYGTVKGKKPIVIGVSAGGVDASQKNVFILNGDQPHVLGQWGTLGRDVLKAKTAALISENAAGSLPANKATEKGLKDAGIQVKSVLFEEGTTDLIGPLTAAGATTADMVVPMVGFPYMVAAVKAVQALGITKPVVVNPLILFIPPVAFPGGDWPKWIVGAAQANTGIATLPDVKSYFEVTDRYDVARRDAADPFSALSAAQILLLVKLMNAMPAGKISSESIAAALNAYKGQVVMGPPSINCGGFKEAIAVCNNQTRFDQYLGAGKWKTVTGWLKPPK
jgi:branched-chain amino acid transport system substrate-binding protein